MTNLGNFSISDIVNFFEKFIWSQSFFIRSFSFAKGRRLQLVMQKGLLQEQAIHLTSFQRSSFAAFSLLSTATSLSTTHNMGWKMSSDLCVAEKRQVSMFFVFLGTKFYKMQCSDYAPDLLYFMMKYFIFLVTFSL